MELTQLAAALPTDAMPGEADPATYALPQQPMHRCAPQCLDNEETRSSLRSADCHERQSLRYSVICERGAGLNGYQKPCD
jgi:hypothetical protein